MLRLHKYGNVPGAASFSFSTLDSAKQFPGPQTLRPFLRVPTKPGGDQKDGVYFFDGVWLRLPRLRTVKGAEECAARRRPTASPGTAIARSTLPRWIGYQMSLA